MNYRHAFHAGNFADVFKHAVFALIVEYLKRKASPFCVIDTHAGIGRYDLAGSEAERTGEWKDGIGRVLEATDRPAALAPLLEAVAAANGGRLPKPGTPLRRYPGSPRIARTSIRACDRMLLAELHPEDAGQLAREFRGDRQVLVARMDGYEAIRAWLPPRERRGVVLVDPPFELRDEFAALAKGLKEGHRRFATGTFVLWYPIKDRAPVDRFHGEIAASGVGKVLAAELLLRPPTDSERLNGCGLVVVTPPWKLDSELFGLLGGLSPLFGGAKEVADTPGKISAVWWLVPE